MGVQNPRQRHRHQLHETLDSINLEKHTLHPYSPPDSPRSTNCPSSCPCDIEQYQADALQEAHDQRFPACLLFTTRGRIVMLMLAVLFVVLVPLGIMKGDMLRLGEGVDGGIIRVVRKGLSVGYEG
jgi:hypothetical protein